jgi:hypothetical protein
MHEAAKRCFYSLADLIGKEAFLRLCTEYLESHLKKPSPSVIESPKINDTYYHHPSINYEWNMGTDNISLQ